MPIERGRGVIIENNPSIIITANKTLFNFQNLLSE